MRQLDNCPLALKYKYIDKLPELEQDYFTHGHKVEDRYTKAIEQYKIDGIEPVRGMTDVELDAKGLWELDTLHHDCATNPFVFQKTFKQCKCKTCGIRQNIKSDEWEFPPCIVCASSNYEKRALIGVLDIYLPGAKYNRDLKTSASEWTQESMQDIKRQAMMYKHFTGQQLWFAVVNKKTHKGKVYPVKVDKLDDLWVRCEELFLTWELSIFPAKPSYKCRFCSFKDVCKEK